MTRTTEVIKHMPRNEFKVVENWLHDLEQALNRDLQDWNKQSQAFSDQEGGAYNRTELFWAQVSLAIEHLKKITHPNNLTR